MGSMTHDDIRQAIDGRLEVLNAEIAQLTEARAALIQQGTAPTVRGPSARKRQGARSRLRRKPLSPESVMQILSNNGGTNAADLARAAQADHQSVLALLHELEVAGQVRRTGQCRGTRWHAITDEDRIQERAAELARRG